jgi:hypothetical protein
MPSIAVTGDLTNTLYGPPGPIESITPTVFAGGKPVATLFAIVGPHGNFSNPQAPGYNPMCEDTELSLGPFSSTVFAGDQPVAFAGGPGIGTGCGCTFHSVLGPGIPTVQVGL